MSEAQSTLDTVVSSLKEALGNNLHSCCLYGSSVRGDAVEGISDINLLVILNESTTGSHIAIAKALDKFPEVDPFILGRRGFERSVKAFAPKFLSIRRNYRVLCGEDVLKDIAIDAQLERFLCEQALRNLRLRLVHAFVTRHRRLPYQAFLARTVTPLFLRLSELVRLNGKELLQEIPARIPDLARELGIEEELLRELAALKGNTQKFNDDEITSLHERVFPVVDKALVWMEQKWPA